MTAMTSRERVLRTLDFETPDRVPRQVWMLPAVYDYNDRAEVDAFLARWPADFSGPPVHNPKYAALRSGSMYEIGTSRDEWGCEFVNVQNGVHGEVKAPLIAEWSDLDKLRPPIEALDFDVDAVNAFCRQSEHFLMSGCCPRPFERMQFLRGSENLYYDLGEESDELRHLLDTIHQFHVKEMEMWARTEVDALSFMDDWGSQKSLLISPKQWRRLFKPLYAEYVRIAHDSGKKAFMHSDGYIFDVYEDLIEIGVDAVNSQLFIMDIEEIGRRFAGKITFWGELDRQHEMVTGTPESVRAAVRRVVDNLWRPEGGAIAQFEMGAGTKIELAEAAYRAWQEFTG